jgi:Holliday junction resolvasome RuvABC endonuclease subunit
VQWNFLIMNILALDLGTATGFAIWNNGAITSGTKKLRHNKNASGLRFLDFRCWLIEMIKEHNIDEVFFERVYAHKGTCAAQCFGGFMYMLATVCEELSVKCSGISVGTIKKFMTGKGNATKEEMIAVAKTHGFNPIDDNEADSVAILLTALHLLKLQQNNRYFLTRGKNESQTPGASLASEVFEMDDLCEKGIV